MTWPGTYFQGHRVQLLLSGEPFFSELFHLIHWSRHSIHLQTYIFDEDETGSQVIDALCDAALRGVKVYLITDAYGTGFSQNTLDRFTKAGIHYRSFSPIRWMRVGKRLHHKVAVSDGSKALIGGINIADKYRGNVKEKPWLDFAALAEGYLCDSIRAVCEKLWTRKFRKVHFRKKQQVFVSGGNLPLALAVNNWYQRKFEVSSSYREAIRNSKKEIIIVASYFLPGTTIRKELGKAAARGVKITILLSGISDVPFVNYATRFLYDRMFARGIEIYEWQQSVLHGKLMLVDGEWVTVGSYNINSLSDYGSIEMNVHVWSETFAASVRQTVVQLLGQGAKQVHERDFIKEKSWWRWLRNALAYSLIRFLLKLYLRMSDDSTGKKLNQDISI